MSIEKSESARVIRERSRLEGLLYTALISPAILFAVYGGEARAQQLPASAFQTYNAADAGSIVASPFALYAVSVDSLLPTQMNEGLTEVDYKAAGFDLISSASALQADLLGDIEPVVIGPGGKLYLTDGHHTFTALEDSIWGPSDPTVYVNVIANYSNLTTAQFFALMQSENLLLPLNDGVPEAVDDATGAPIPTSLTGLTSDVYRGLEYSILKNKSSKLFSWGATTPGLDKMTGFYSDFLEAAAYQNANGGLGLPYLSPYDIALATKWNLTGSSTTTLPNVSGAVTAAQLPGFILSQNIVNAGGISDATLANGAMDGDGTFTGITEINAGTASEPIMIGTPNVGFIMELGTDNGYSVTLDGTNSYTGGTSILAGNLIVQSDASLGAAPTETNAAFLSSLTLNSAGYPTNVLTAVQADDGIIFNSLTEGAGTLTIGTTTGGTFTTSRPIAVGSESATINVNDNTVTLLGSLVSLGTNNVALGNADGESALTIDDLSTADAGKLILSTPSPYFYGDIIIGNTGAPTVEVMDDAALGATTGSAGTIGEVELNGGTLQAGASFAAPERDVFLGGGSTFDVNGFTTSWGTLTDVQRTLEVTNSNATTQGAVAFSSFIVASTATLQLTGGSASDPAGETVTFTDGISRSGAATLILNSAPSISLGSSTEKVFSGTGAASLENGIAPAWIVTSSVKNGVGPYNFVTYGADGYVSASDTSTATLNTTTTSSEVVALSGNVTLGTGVNADVFALNTEGKNITLGATGSTLTIGDNSNPAGLILASGTTIKNGTLAFGGSEGVIWLSGSSTISSEITGMNGLTFAGSGSVTLSAANVSGAITIDTGTVTLAGANVFSSDVAGVTLEDTKSHPAAATLSITANNMLTTVDVTGKNGSLLLSNGAALTLGDSVNNLSSTVNGKVTESGVAVAGALTLDGSGLFDFSGMKSGALSLVAGSSIVVNNSAQFRVVASAFANSGIAIVLNGTSQLQLAENGGDVLANTVSGTGELHLMSGTLQITGTNNTYTGGTVVETGATLDVTTANLPTTNPNITDAGGLILFNQATTGTYAGVISDGYEMGTGPLLSGSLDKDDSSGANRGNLILTNAQTFTGETYVEAGTLTLDAVDTLATSSGVDLGRVGGCVGTCSSATAAATLALGANNTIQSLSSETGNTTAVTLGAYTLTIATPSGVDASFGGSISGAGSLVKSGAGGQALTGAVSVAALTVDAGLLDVGSGGSIAATTTDVDGGTLELDSGSSISSSTIDVAAGGAFYIPGGSATLAASTFNNSGVLNIQNGSATNVFTVGAYDGAAGSQLQVGVNFNAGTADRLVVSSVTGSTQIVVTDVAPTLAASYDPTGIPIVVSSAAMNSSTFTLAGGPIQKGLFQYDLAYNADPEFVLVGTPSADAFRLAAVPTAAQSIWFDTAGVWLDRQADLRDLLVAGAPIPAAKPGDGDGAPPVTPGVWARAVGDWADRDQTQSYSALNKTYDFETGYRQNVAGVYGGMDVVRENVLGRGDALLFGATAGYVGSTQDFNASNATATFDGGSVGVSATYLNQNFFVDALLKGDFLTLNYSAPTDTAYGAGELKAHVVNLGAVVDTGYRFALGGKTFAEPLATLAYVSSRIGDLSLSGAQIGFGDNDALRARLGVRGGATVVDTAAYRIDASATASYWGRLSGGASTVIDSGSGAPSLTLFDKQVTNYGEVGLALNYSSVKTGWSGFVKADYDFASGYNAGALKGGVRYDF
jgi:autotransporter-associated beta strand protein